MGSKKLIKKGFISVISACLVLSSSFNSYALSQEVETQGVKYTLELEGVAEVGEELTATFAPSNQVGGMQTVIYTWFIDDEQVYFDWGIEKENSIYTINQGEVGEVYVIVDFGDLNNINQQLKSNSLMIEKTEGSEGGENGGSETEEAEYTLELTGTPSVGEELTGLFFPYEKVKGDVYYCWWLNGNVVNTDGLSDITTYTVQEEDEGKIYIEAQFENSNSEYMTIKSNILTIEKSNTEGGGSDDGDSGADNKGDTGDTGDGEGNTDNSEGSENAGNENTDNKNEAGDTDNKGDNETGDTGSGEGSEDGAGDTESGENTDDKDNTDSGTGEDGSLDDDINISTPSDAEKEENTGNNDIIDSGKDEEDKTDNNNSNNENINTDNSNNSNSSNSSNSNNSNSHSSSSHSSSKSTNSEVYKWEFVNYKNGNYKWFWKSNKGNIHKGWLQCPLDGYWYYFDLEEGYMLEGLQVIEGKTYYFQKQEETPSQTYYLEGGEWVYRVPEGGTNPWGSLLNIEL